MVLRNEIRAALGVAMALLVLCGTGCGWIADKDRIRIAKVDDRYVTRGDLYQMLRDMPDEDRPQIGTKGDLVRVVREHVDSLIKIPLGEQLEAEGTIKVPREKAMQQFFAMHPEENYQLLFSEADPASFGMSPTQWKLARDEAEMAIDRIEARIRGDAAVMYLAVTAAKNQELDISDEEYEGEYKLRADALKTFERMHFMGIRFPSSDPNAAAEAADVRKRIDAGERFETVADEYLAKGKDYILNSDIQNDPSAPGFRGFWISASGAEPGDILGPIFMPASVGTSTSDSTKVMSMPDAYVVFQVLERWPERQLTLEEAKPVLAPVILVAKMMKRLREEHGVELYYDKLPDPGMFARREGGDPISGVE
ncbi:MAG TPA: peptidylprolyl isomerase [Candidatus Hydrogenedentes bacterium]|nr:peptidylprolyl isomerase [Candidatus Hydrogenedentota bacterium]HPG67179.1 peptidylprolyl isomerase [Candidatus Hydrogenedentota bacterium]